MAAVLVAYLHTLDCSNRLCMAGVVLGGLRLQAARLSYARTAAALGRLNRGLRSFISFS